MKKLFVLFAFLGMVSLAQAQCTKSAKSTTASKGKTSCAVTAKAAATAASLDDSIEKRECAKSGKVSYVKKSTCAKSGNVSFTNVEYCTKSKKFVNMSPSQMEAGAKKAACTKKATATGVSAKKSCTKAEKAACAKTAANGKKPCCAKGKGKKAACSKSKTAAKEGTTTTNEVKAVKVSND